MKLVPLTQGKFARVSGRDWPLVCRYKWCAVNLGKKRECWYAMTGFPNAFSMHRLILGFPKGLVDHKDCNGLNNQRRNLRRASGTQNRANARLRSDNKSKVTGVYAHPSGGWVAQVKSKYLGYFATKEAATRARKRAARKEFGRYART